MTSYIEFPRWLVWGFGAMFIFGIIASQISSWFDLDWSYMRWVALFGYFISFVIGAGVSIYYDKLEEKNKEVKE